MLDKLRITHITPLPIARFVIKTTYNIARLIYIVALMLRIFV